MLQSYADNTTGECWPRHEALAERMGIHVDNVRRALSAIVRKGIVHAELRPGHSTLYRFPLHPSALRENAETVGPEGLRENAETTPPELSPDSAKMRRAISA